MVCSCIRDNGSVLLHGLYFLCLSGRSFVCGVYVCVCVIVLLKCKSGAELTFQKVLISASGDGADLQLISEGFPHQLDHEEELGCVNVNHRADKRIISMSRISLESLFKRFSVIIDQIHV